MNKYEAWYRDVLDAHPMAVSAGLFVTGFLIGAFLF